MPASYPNSIKNFTDKVDGFDDVMAADINELQDEVVAIETCLGPKPPQPSVLINGGFDVYQRQDPTVPTSRSDDTYGPDRWYVLVQTGAINVHRVSGDTNSQYAARLTQAQATAQRFGIAQIVEAANSIPLRQRAVRFQVRVKPSTSTTIRAAILAWKGAKDSVVSDVVNDWSSASYIPGGFFAAANLTVIGTAAVTASPDQYSDLAVTGVVPANCNNLIVVVWTESAAAQNVTIDLTQAGLYDGAAPRAWLPRPAGEEQALCMRYFERLDGPAAGNIFGFGYNDLANRTVIMIHFYPKRVAPAISFSALATFHMATNNNYTPSGLTANQILPSQSRVVSTHTGGLTTGYGANLQSLGSAYIDINAEL